MPGLGMWTGQLSLSVVEAEDGIDTARCSWSSYRFLFVFFLMLGEEYHQAVS